MSENDPMKTLTLELDGTKPDKLPLSRLSKYLKELSSLYGNEKFVYFDRVRKGSACLDTFVQDDHLRKVMGRISEASNSNTKGQHRGAYNRLQDLMADDGVNGRIKCDNAVVLQFPKTTGAQVDTIRKRGSVQGVLYRVGGKDDTVPVRLEGANGEQLRCETDRAMASELAHYLFQNIRVTGEGEWIRVDGGPWKLKKLKVHSYRTLKSDGFRKAMKDLRMKAKFNWEGSNSPHDDILKSRG